jgi:hypothetical protein
MSLKNIPWRAVLAVIIIAGLAVLFLSACSSVPGLRVKSKFGKEYADQFNVTGNKDQGTPATAESSGSKATVPLPTGSEVKFTPAEGVDVGMVSVKLSAPSSFSFESRGTKASTGTIDTATAKHRIDVETAAKEREPLLWVAIGCGVLGVLALIVLKEWPSIGKGLLAASVLASIAWKVAEVPWWAWLAVLAGVGLVIAGYKRAEWDANGDGVPDILQRKP